MIEEEEEEEEKEKEEEEGGEGEGEIKKPTATMSTSFLEEEFEVCHADALPWMPSKRLDAKSERYAWNDKPLFSRTR